MHFLRNKDLYFEYCEVMKYSRGDQIQQSMKGFIIDLITPDHIWSPHENQKMIPYK